MKFRLLRGTHAEGRAEDTQKIKAAERRLKAKEITEEEFKQLTAHLKPRRVYSKGQLVESNRDLRKLNGPHPMMQKFALASDLRAQIDEEESKFSPFPDAEEDPVMAELNTMSIAELKQLAEDEEIDLGDATKKADILKVIKEAKGLALA